MLYPIMSIAIGT